jgi:hypothetical protein
MKQEGVDVNFQSWKWISLRYRRRFVFILLNASLCAMWLSLFLSSNDQCSACHRHRQYLYVNGTISAILCLHSIVLLLSVCDCRLQSFIEYNDRLGKGLVHAVVFSLFLVLLFSVSVYTFEPSKLFELSFNAAAITLLLPRLLHNLGYCKNEIIICSAFFCIPWCVIFARFDIYQLSAHFWVVLVSLMAFCFVDIYIQDGEYKYHFDALKTSIHSKEKEKNFDFRDIISTVNTVVDMINQLEFDIRYRISRGLEYYNPTGDINNGNVMYIDFCDLISCHIPECLFTCL